MEKLYLQCELVGNTRGATLNSSKRRHFEVVNGMIEEAWILGS